MDPRDELNIGFYEMRLRVDPNKIDRELIEHPELYFHVAEGAALANSRATAAKEMLSKCEARLYAEVVSIKEQAKERATEAAIRNEILLHPERQEAFDALQAATLEAAKWAALRESFSSRGYMLRDLCQLTLSGYLSSQTVSGPATSAVKDVSAARAKEALEKKRTGSWRAKLEG